MTRLFKQLFILFVFFSVIGLIGLTIYNLEFKKETCFDNVQNQDEEGIDCGGVCELTCFEKGAMPIEVGSRQLFAVRGFDYDALFELSNPNTAFGASRIDYVLEFTTESGMFQRSGVTYIAPGETRYIIESPLSFSGLVSGFDVRITNIEWQVPIEFFNVSPTQLFAVRERTYNSEAQRLTAVLVNTSDVSFDTVEAHAFLYQGPDIIAVSRSIIKTLRSGEARKFEVFWPGDIGEPSRIVIEGQTNILDETNLLQFIRTPEPFQQ